MIIFFRNWRRYFYLKKMAPVVALVNLSNASLNAVQYAADMATELHTRLIMVHVVQLSEVCLSLSNDEAAFYKVQDQRAAWLTELKKHLLARTGNKIDIEDVMLHGEPENELEKFCALQKPLLLITGLDANIHLQNNINVASLSEEIKCPLLIVPPNLSYQAFNKVSVIINQDEQAVDGIVSSIRKWLNQLVSYPEPEIHASHFIKFVLDGFTIKEKVDLLVNATNDTIKFDTLLQSVQSSFQAENFAPAILSLTKETLRSDKAHDCSVCNGACRAKKNITNAQVFLK